jgi:predicted TIM-barrel fold metal-dependent hydrolase
MIIDCNAYVGHWPFRHLPWREPAQLVRKLRSLDIAEAWVASFEGLSHKDIAGVNARLAEDCRNRGEKLLVPFGTVNPTLPDWEEDLRRCHEEHHMPGIRLHPNYHDYRLDDSVFARLLRLAAERKLVVQVSLRVEDERTQLKRFPVPAVDPRPLPAVLAAVPGVRLVILNGAFDLKPGERKENLTGAFGVKDELLQLARAGSVHFDFSMIEGVRALAQLVEQAGGERVLFGSHAPLYYPEAALLKIKEAALKPEEAQAVQVTNARRLLARDR